ncbi:Gfo/Idh/MocA family oxidoreductase, partial [Streptomyces sp. NPDC059456]|uniref:Gfo/Idh/MocA family oxidoreductase n=1 Tax=Streptomyces sp. NPDC059456 TaxID=3346838 RepID=UPI0036A47E1C
MKPLVHAVVGCGRVAPNHVDGFSALPDAELRWACDRDPSRARALAREYGIPRVTSDVREVLADPVVGRPGRPRAPPPPPTQRRPPPQGAPTADVCDT